ncbi:MAG: Pr6Pr family membrane protein [Treponema sp.]|nr:Pr6Pr family membrane protein [Treponema sp.]
MEKIAGNGRRISRIIFNAALICCGGVGVALTLMRLDAAMALSAFTIQSNLLCLVAAGVTLAHETARRNHKGKTYIFFKGMALTSILLTFFIYNFVLKPYFNATNQTQGGSLMDTLIHVVVPLMALVDFLVFEEKGRFRPWHPLGWTAFPIYYIGYTAVYKAFGGVYKFSEGAAAKFPYFFLDYETYGLKTVGIWVLFIAIGFIGFSYLLFGLDRVLAKIKKV